MFAGCARETMKHSSVPLWRARFLATLMLVGWTLLVARLVQLHLGRGAEFEHLADRQRIVREPVAARPGDIVDRHGRVFATSVTARSVYVVPRRVRQAWTLSQDLGRALGLEPDRLFERIAAHPDRQFLWIKRRISDAEAERVRALKLPADIVGFRDEFKRVYPQGTTGAHVVGMRDIDGLGRGGVEETCHRELRGVDGMRELIHDARGRVIEVCAESPRPPRAGRTVTLTLDAVIQVHAEGALDKVLDEWKPRSACAIVLDPKSGDVLAMACRPAFDPNHPELSSPDVWKNRAIADIYEPGSTFKPFVVAWALQHGLLQQDEVFHCENGEYRMGRRVLHDHHPYARLNVVDILVKSSNIGMAKIGERMGNARLYHAAAAFGFGGKTGIELPGELPGKLRPLKQWNAYSTGSIPMGQEIATTPLQIITAYGVLANGGRMITPHVVARTTDDSPADGSVIVSPVVDAGVADWVRKTALTAVVSRGTGKKARIDGYEVFGKSGTAQKLDPETGKYSNTRHVSSFVCGAPASDPRALVIVSVDEPSVALNGEHFGGSVAAPAAAEILRKTLHQLQVPTRPDLMRSAHRARDDQDSTDDL